MVFTLRTERVSTIPSTAQFSGFTPSMTSAYHDVITGTGFDFPGTVSAAVAVLG